MDDMAIVRSSSGESYLSKAPCPGKKKFPYSKIFNPRNLYGIPNQESFKVARAFAGYLDRKCETFIGISPIHSEVLGHSMSDSDFDFMILYDPSIYGNELYDDYHAERQIYHTALDFIRQEYGKDKPKIDFFYRDINLDEIAYSLNLPVRSTCNTIAKAIRDLSNVVTGNKIGVYRKNLSNLLRENVGIPLGEIVQEAADLLLQLEKSSLQKLWDKKSLKDGFENLLNARKDLWKYRILCMYGLNENLTFVH